MAETLLPPAKRALKDATNTAQHLATQLPSAKKRKLDRASSGIRAPWGDENALSSQPKSQFEEQLEKLTPNISNLKSSNAEQDQKWQRPPLDDFDPASDKLCFQQIEAEEGTLSGNQQTVRLFGVTEVCWLIVNDTLSLTVRVDRSLCHASRHRLPSLFIH